MREGYGSCLVCVSMCLSVPVLAASVYIYSRVSLLDFDSWIFENTFRSNVMASNMQKLELCASNSHTFRTRSDSNRMLLQMLAASDAAHGVKQAG